MATTTNFGWTTPDDTDLVKDGASAIRTLGSAIDTSLVDLKGGTTGQVLAKASDTDMDFTWDDPASGSMTLLSTTSLTGSSVSLSSISQSYRDLRLEIKDVTFSTNNSEILIRYNGDTGANYAQTAIVSQVGVTNTINSYAALTSNNLTYYVAMQNTSVDAAFQIDLYDYKNTTAIRIGRGIASYQKGYSTAGDKMLIHQASFYNNVGTTISSIDIAMSSGTFSSGTVYLYGVN